MCAGTAVQFGIPRVVVADAVNASSDEIIRFIIKNELRFETSHFPGVVEFIWERGNRFQISLKLCLGVD